MWAESTSGISSHLPGLIAELDSAYSASRRSGSWRKNAKHHWNVLKYLKVRLEFLIFVKVEVVGFDSQVTPITVVSPFGLAQAINQQPHSKFVCSRSTTLKMRRGTKMNLKPRHEDFNENPFPWDRPRLKAESQSSKAWNPMYHSCMSSIDYGLQVEWSLQVSPNPEDFVNPKFVWCPWMYVLKLSQVTHWSPMEIQEMNSLFWTSNSGIRGGS